ncbi:hypothetical protein CURTO8I2_70324 [Curtobacterium sp. 8I-2]|nr:hypothetical protein CURTO8I2_70324 [Curtobacterium sp. 8I-2]
MELDGHLLGRPLRHPGRRDARVGPPVRARPRRHRYRSGHGAVRRLLRARRPHARPWRHDGHLDALLSSMRSWDNDGAAAENRRDPVRLSVGLEVLLRPRRRAGTPPPGSTPR